MFCLVTDGSEFNFAVTAETYETTENDSFLDGVLNGDYSGDFFGEYPGTYFRNYSETLSIN